PDRNPGDKAAEEKFKEAAEAYAILADSDKRAAYDRFGHAGVSSAAGAGAGFDPSVFSGFEDILGGLGDIFGFGDIFGGRRRGGPQRGADLRYDLEITFEESARGAETSSEIPVNFTTLALGGEIQVPTLDALESVKVSEGTQTGTTLRLRGKGMPDVNGRGRGDLFATVQVQTPKKLTREQRRILDDLSKVL